MWYLVAFVVFCLFSYIAYVIIYGLTFQKVADAYLAQFDSPEGERLVIRTDGLFPVLGPKPPERAMWRVKQGFFVYKGNLMASYRYNPDQLENADLDYPENIDAEIRSMEAHGRAVMQDKNRT